MMRKKRPISMQMPSAVFIHCVFAVSPANADPLLFDADAKAYSTSERPWAPGFRIETSSTVSRSTEMPAKLSIATGMARMNSVTSFISGAWIFLPRYSGVRPTMRPAMNTARMA